MVLVLRRFHWHQHNMQDHAIKLTHLFSTRNINVSLPGESAATTGDGGDRSLSDMRQKTSNYSRVKFVVHYFLGGSLSGVRPLPPEFRRNGGAHRTCYAHDVCKGTAMSVDTPGKGQRRAGFLHVCIASFKKIKEQTIKKSYET